MSCPYCKTENQPGAVRCAACTSWMVQYPPVREWLRPREGRFVAGVCRGLAERFGLPIAAVRLAFLLGLILGGWGLVLYVVLWIAMPPAPDTAIVRTGMPPPPLAPERPPAAA